MGKVVFQENGRVDCDLSDCWDVAEYFAATVAAAIGTPVKAEDRSSKGEILYWEGVGVAARPIASIRIIDAAIYIRGKGPLVTGKEDTRSREERVAGWFGAMSPETCMFKFRAGCGLGQNYISGNGFRPVSLVFTGTRNPRKGRTRAGTKKWVSDRLYEAFLGAVGQLRQMPYEGHSEAPPSVIHAVRMARTAEEVAKVICLRWREIFTPLEAERIWARRINSF